MGAWSFGGEGNRRNDGILDEPPCCAGSGRAIKSVRWYGCWMALDQPAFIIVKELGLYYAVAQKLSISRTVERSRLID